MSTLRHRIELETFFLIAIAAGVSLFLVLYRNNFQFQFTLTSDSPSMKAQVQIIAPKITVSSQISSDGTKKVIMKATESADNTTYEVSTMDEETKEKLIFTKTLSSEGNMEIPFNTWSPDNKYFFIEENAGGVKKVFVYKAAGEPFDEKDPYLDATESFRNANTGNYFDEATGWASETLIIMNSKKPDGEKGFSYWFEVPSKAIIQLATDF